MVKWSNPLSWKVDFHQDGHSQQLHCTASLKWPKQTLCRKEKKGWKRKGWKRRKKEEEKRERKKREEDLRQRKHKRKWCTMHIYTYFVSIHECACCGVVQSDVVCDVLSQKQSNLCVVSAAIWAASMSKESCLFTGSELYWNTQYSL